MATLPVGPLQLGRAKTFFTTATISWANYGGNTVGLSPDMIVNLNNPTTGLIICNKTASTVLRGSINGNYDCFEIDTTVANYSPYLILNPFIVSSLWFRISTGASCNISVMAWTV